MINSTTQQNNNISALWVYFSRTFPPLITFSQKRPFPNSSNAGCWGFFNDSSYYSNFDTSSPLFTECEQRIRLRKLSSKEKRRKKKSQGLSKKGKILYKYNFLASENQNVNPVILKSITKYCLEINSVYYNLGITRSLWEDRVLDSVSIEMLKYASNAEFVVLSK